MNSLKINRNKLLNDIISNYFSKKEEKEFKSIFSSELSSFKSFSEQVSAKNKKQVSLNINNEADLQFKIELLITFAQQRLKAEKYAEFLGRLGNFTVTLGETDLAVMIYQSILAYAIYIEGISDFVVADSYYKLGELYRKKSKWDVSFSYIEKAKKIYQQFNDTAGLSKCANILGSVYGEMGEFTKAKRNFERALRLLGSLNNPEETGKTEINLGIVNDILGDQEDSKDYYRKALFKFTKSEDNKRIAEIYHNLGMLNLSDDKLKQAVYDFDNSIHYCMKINYMPVLGLSYLGKALALVKNNDLKLAEQFADKAAVLFNKTKDRLSTAEVYRVKGVIYRKKKMYPKAEHYLNTSLRINVEIGNKLNKAETNVELGILLKDRKKTKESNENLEQALKYYESIKARERIRQIESLDA